MTPGTSPDSGAFYVCDLDGTLLRPDATLSPFARDGLNRLLDSGIALTAASARSVAAMRVLLDGLRLTLPVIELNGAFITDLTTGQHLVGHALSPAAAVQAVRVLAAAAADPVLTTWDGAADHVSHGPRQNPGSTWYVREKEAYGDPRLRVCADLPAVALGEHVATVTGFVPDPEAERIARRLRDNLGEAAHVSWAANGYAPGWTEIHIAHPLADKGAALPVLAAHAGLAQVPVTACGDHLNDLTMFDAAQHTIAPANAHPAVRARADTVVPANHEDGVVRFLLEKHFGPARLGPVPTGDEARPC
ncbi:HAD family hydrolase [Streptomyces sp. NPDC005566]|uniref:HAD family hydrolase n=1 Tax=Streptomyces sp. NPDC005566 TaxID=3156886 RepID=UPI0033A7DA22